MDKSVKRIAVTGAAGQIAYSLLFRLARGELFGSDQPIALHLLELPEALPFLEGVCMELQDCAFPLLQEVRKGSDPFELFEAVDIALLVGAKPRGPGMERSDLLTENAKLFFTQGKALEEKANRDVKVVVVGNPCNTNCLIALKQAKRVDAKNFSAMMRLDQNRAQALLAIKAGVKVADVNHVTIWGNHSNTQVPDPYNATFSGRPIKELIDDDSWLQTTFASSVQNRGAEVIKARGKSSAASAANALIDHLKALYIPTPKDSWFSMAVYSKGNSYGIDEDLIFSFPCRSKGDGSWEFVDDLPVHPSLIEKIKITEKELQQERQKALCT